MPRKPSGRVSNSLLTSSKQYDEDRPSQDSVTSHSSASSQDTFDFDQTDQFSTSGDSDSVEDDQKQLIREYVATCKAKNKIKKHGQHAKNWQEHATRASIEQYYLTEESDDDFENIKTEPSNEESEQLCYSSASTSISDPLIAPRPTQAAEVKCLQQTSEDVIEESSGDESPLASYRRYQQQEGAEVHLHRLKEFKKCFPEYGDKASSEKRELSEEKLRQLAIEHVDALRVICHRLNIREYLPKKRIKESVEQYEQQHPKTIKYGTQTVSENVVKHELQDESTRTASETVEQHEQSLAKGHSLYLTDIEGDSEDADMHPNAFEEIETELSSQGYDQICEVTASDSIADLEPNVNDQDITLGECDPLGGINGVSVKTENNVLEEEYEVEKFIQMEIDIESEGPQQIKPREGKNSMASAIIVRNKNDEKSVEQVDQILRKLLQCVSTQTVSDHVDHDHQYASKFKPNESVEQRQQSQTKLKLVDEKRKKLNQSGQQYLKRKNYESVEWREQCIKNIRQNGSVGENFANTKLREPCRNIAQCELEYRASKSVENDQCLDKIPQDDIERRGIESFQLVQPHRTINIQQYISEHRSGGTDEQRQQRIENFRRDLICKVNQCIEKYESRPKIINSSTLNIPNYAEKRRQHQGRAIQNYFKQKSFSHAEEREKRLKIYREYIEKLYTKLNAEERIQILEKLQKHGACESIEQSGQCKSNRNLLRNKFIHSITRRKAVTGQASIDLNKWKHQDQMPFLLPFVGNKNTIASKIGEFSSQTTCASNTPTTFKNTKRKKREVDYRKDKVNILDVGYHKRSERNGIDLFFRSIADTVKKLPNIEQIKLKFKIMKMVHEVEVRMCLE